MTGEELDRVMMRIALTEAHAAARAGEVPVGAVIGDPGDGRVVARAGNRAIVACDPTAHAEIRALREAALATRNYRLPRLAMWVTLEPCAMCAGAILQARLARLVFAAEDVKGGAVRHGTRIFDAAPAAPDWGQGPFATEAASLLRDFFAQRRHAAR